MGVKPHLLLSLSQHSKESGDEGDLAWNVSFLDFSLLRCRG